MINFTFDLPTKIYLGNGLFYKTADYISNITKGRRVFLVTDQGMEKIGLADILLKQLQKKGFEVEIFSKVVPNPKDADCTEGGEAARSFDADCIVALGGGSVIDAAKAIAVLQMHGGMPQEYAGRGNVPGPVKPLVAIPTTAGTGAEVTRSSVITDTKRKIKFTIKDVRIAPAAAIVDPELTYGLPPALTASTGMDALVHSIEAYTCKLSNPVSDGLAIQAMKHIYPNLRRAVENGSDKEARYHMMTGSMIAGMAFSHADVASVHCMAEAIGGLYDTPHGVANSMFLPYLIEFNAEADTYKHAEIARTFGLAGEKESDSEAAVALVHEVKQLAKDIEIPSFASLVEARTEDFDYLAKSAFENGSTPSNARDITEEDYKNLFYKAFESKP
ncbi:iron-containing alcohol dehydrogenase [Evansella clarkii]|uniref:iron-containing alcohol dehydrogenase n=1 Tax=Evansella clarkii TaxID=79879 RepID=UPI000B4494D9|nr:iron-containing alcohol dehydrogenase [Evansella clarkii]